MSDATDEPEHRARVLMTRSGGYAVVCKCDRKAPFAIFHRTPYEPLDIDSPKILVEVLMHNEGITVQGRPPR